MKKIFALIIMLILTFCFAACDFSTGGNGNTKNPYAASETTSDMPMSPDVTDLVGGQWYTSPDFGRVNLYFNSTGDFVEEIEMFTQSYFTYGNPWSQQWLGAWWNPGMQFGYIVLKGRYSISDGTLTLTYASAERYPPDGPVEAIELPDNVSVPYKLNMQDWDPFNDKEQAMLRIKGLIPPLDKIHTNEQLSPDKSELVFWLNENYTGGPMGYVENQRKAAEGQ